MNFVSYSDSRVWSVMNTVAVLGSRITPDVPWVILNSKVSDGSRIKSGCATICTQVRELPAVNVSVAETAE